MIVTKVLIWGIIILMISVYSSQCGLDFYNTFINVAKKLSKK